MSMPNPTYSPAPSDPITNTTPPLPPPPLPSTRPTRKSLLPSPFPPNDLTPALENPHQQTPAAEEEEIQAPVDFTPFFTLITDTHTSDQYHPTVHYIFSDDSSDLITSAALRALAPSDSGSSLLKTEEEEEARDEGRRTDTEKERREGEREGREEGEGDAEEALLPPSRPGVQERYLILDIAPQPAAATTPSSNAPHAASVPPERHADRTSFHITSAHSLTPSYAILNATLTPAPTWDDAPSRDSPTSVPGKANNNNNNRGLMLKIEGSEGIIDRSGNGSGGGGGGGGGGAGEGPMNEDKLIELFAQRMEELRKVVDSGR
ncbi:MAG: hypothetical protein M1827_007198 [Pycnora praestabilis]|nr:MAG: hypothetical protein M1827_007198 [Pycnora praestabilis]